MKALGKGFGKNSFKVKALIEAADGNHLKAEIEARADRETRCQWQEIFEIGAEHVTFTEKLPAEVFSCPDAGCNGVCGCQAG
ncbi:MAG: hypothetical protein M0C28_47430 [Candidatus Moduliflexus flocculans]|nr:hypothetical protein [Candidatus Moduliflexus flocculans]